MTSLWDSFERYKQRGLDARRAGQWDAARTYLLEAARQMLQIAKDARTEPLREARRATAQKLLDLARDCDAARKANRAAPGVSRSNSPQRAGEGDDGTNAHDWMIKEKPDVRFDHVAGLEDVKAELRLKMLYPFQHPELAAQFGVKAGGGVLLFGPPGTGKTLLARATAGELDAAFFVVSPADIMSKWVGEAEQNIKKLFDAAAAEPRSIVFIDEIESLVPARRDEGSSVMQRVVPQILQSVEGFRKSKSSILLMGATNVPWQLDPAILRPGRFDEKIYIPLPDQAARKKMLEIYLGKRPVDDDVDFESLSVRLDGFSGADIKYICDRAAVIPFLQAVNAGGNGEPSDHRITRDVLDDVIADTKPSVRRDHLSRFEQWASQM